MKLSFAIATACLFSALSITAPSTAEARKFDFNTETFAPYLGGTYGLSQVGTSAFGTSDGENVTTDQSVSTSASGEFGFLLSFKRVNFKIGCELLLPKTLDGVNGKSASGTPYFTLNSSLMAVVPMATLEFVGHQTPESRFVVGLGYGVALLTLENDYTMTSAGTTALGVGSMNEKGSARAMAAQIYGGYEFLFSDTATLALDLGYRYIPVTTIDSTQTVTAPSGSETSGQPLTNIGGGNRTVNLSGAFAGVSLRFYIAL